MVTSMTPIKPIHDGMCKGCALGKNVKKPYSSSSRRSKRILDLIHFDHVVWWLHLPWVDAFITWSSLMVIHVRPGSISWTQRVKLSLSFRNLGPSSKSKQDRTFMHRGLIIVVNLIHIISLISVGNRGSRGSWQFCTTPSKMGLLRERTEQSMRHPKPWCNT